MKKKIRRRCKCGCGNITNYGNVYIHGHNRHNKKHTVKAKNKISGALQERKLSAKHKLKLSLAHRGKKPMLGHKHSVETRNKMSLAAQNRSKEHKLKLSLAAQNRSAETKLKMSLAKMKYDPHYEYCDVWKSREYKKDIRKDYCENVNCEKISKRLHNHHVHLDKKRCAPNDIVTLCNSCHSILHHILQRGTNASTNPKDFIIINRLDHISYIHKKSRMLIIRINKG